MLKDPIIRLKSIFNEFNIKKGSQITRLPRNYRERIDNSVYLWFKDYQTEIINDIQSKQGLNLALSWPKNTGGFSTVSGAGTCVKKLSFFSNAAYIFIPEFRDPSFEGLSIPTAWYQLILNFWPLIVEGMLMILPDRITMVDEIQTAGKSPGLILTLPPNEKDLYIFRENTPSLKIIDLSINLIT